MDDCEDISQLVAKFCVSSPTTGTFQPFSCSIEERDKRVPYAQMQPSVNHQENVVENNKTSNANDLDQNLLAVESLSIHNQVMHQLPVVQNEGGDQYVLRVVVENLVYPITIDILYKIFTKFGKIEKIITFLRHQQFQALIQMEHKIDSQAAKLCLDGQNIYKECCTLRVDYSRLPYLNVKYNNDKSRDYTRNDLPSGEAVGTIAQLNNGMNPYNLPKIQLASLSQNGNSMSNLQQSHLGMITHEANGQFFDPNLNFKLAAVVENHLYTVLHVSNLNKDLVTPNVLFTLFGVYGDVVRVKILYKTQTSALVQMKYDMQAYLVKKYLNGAKLFGQTMQIVKSNHRFVRLPREGQDGENLTQDYGDSCLHRFKKPGSKNFCNIFPPSEVLHLSNIPPGITGSFIKEAFSKHVLVNNFKFFPKNKKMALIRLDSVDSAITALVKMHNFKLTENYHLRVSFSKGYL